MQVGVRDPPPDASTAIVTLTSPGTAGVARSTPGADDHKDTGIGAAIGIGIGSINRTSTATGADGRQRSSRRARASQSAVAGLPRWLEIVLVAAGLLIGTAFLTEPTLAIARRRRATHRGPKGARIVLADYDRLVVTHCGIDGTVYVLRPPGADPQAILLAARLVLAQDRYEELAGQLGVPAHWPRE